MKKMTIVLTLLLCCICALCACKGDQHEHVFGEWVETKAPTCEKGSQKRYCSVCQYEEVSDIPADANTHVISDGACTVCLKTVDQIRLEKMTRKVENQYGALYFDESDDSIGYYNKMTDEIIFTNPESVEGLETVDYTANKMMSQVVLTYRHWYNALQPEVYREYQYNSYRQSDVIVSCENVENGIRVSYHMPRIVLPAMIERSALEEKILKPLSEKATRREYAWFRAFYNDIFYKTWSDPDGGEYRPMYAEAAAIEFPVTAKKNIDVCILQYDISHKDLLKMAEMVELYCPDYTKEELEKDHAFVEYDSRGDMFDNIPAVITALTFVIDENGLTVDLADAYDTDDGQILSLNGDSYVASNLPSNAEITLEFLPYLRFKQYDCVTILCE